MRHAPIEFGHESAARFVRNVTLARSVVLTSLFVAFGALLTAIWIEKSLDAHGDRYHLENPAGPDQAVALRVAGVDLRSLNPDATEFLGTRWLEGVALLGCVFALTAATWLSLRTGGVMAPGRGAHQPDPSA